MRQDPDHHQHEIERQEGDDAANGVTYGDYDVHAKTLLGITIAFSVLSVK